MAGTGHTRGEDRIRTGKDTGIGYLPSRYSHINQVWLELALIAAGPARSVPVDAAHRPARAAPRRAHDTALQAAARHRPHHRGQRKVFLRLAEHWPWALALAKALTRLQQIPFPA